MRVPALARTRLAASGPRAFRPARRSLVPVRAARTRRPLLRLLLLRALLIETPVLLSLRSSVRAVGVSGAVLAQLFRPAHYPLLLLLLPLSTMSTLLLLRVPIRAVR